MRSLTFCSIRKYATRRKKNVKIASSRRTNTRELPTGGQHQGHAFRDQIVRVILDEELKESRWSEASEPTAVVSAKSRSLRRTLLATKEIKPCTKRPQSDAWGRDAYVRDPTHNSIPSKIYYSSADQKESLKKA
ncbi:hypothetical protein Peur_021533 [Populus x canadensis]